MKECPYCVGFPCTECLFCTKFYNNGQRVIKRTKTLPLDSEERYIMPKKSKKKPASYDDPSSPLVPASYMPMTEKEAEIACSMDYEFEDFRTMPELERDLDRIISNMRTGGKRLF